MSVTITPSRIRGTITIPPSKSISHRAIICASLSKGESVITNVSYSDDILATIDAMKLLGATITKNKNSLFIRGIKDFNNYISTTIDCKESGSTLRFLIPIFSLCNHEIKFIGKPSLFSRPLDIYESIFTKQNLMFKLEKSSLTINGAIKAKEYRIKGNVSSQFISGLLLTLPLLKEDSIIRIMEPFESKSYVDITLDIMKKFGVEAKFTSALTIAVKGNQEYKPCNFEVEGDYSQFAFFAVLGALNNDISCHGLNKKSFQGDRAIVEILKRFQVKVESTDQGYAIYKSKIEGFDIDLKDCPDLGPILMILSLFSKKPVCIKNISRLRLKESDRIEAMEHNLKLLGADLVVSENEMTINPSRLKACKEILASYNDHRIVMALSVLGTVLNAPITIDNHLCVNKSYKEFFEDIKSLGAGVIIHV